MAYENNLQTISLEADADLSAAQYKAVKLSTDGQVALQASEGGWCLGILQNKPGAAGRAASVGIGGISKAHVNGGSAAIAAGDPLQASTASKLIKATTGDQVIARALNAVSTGVSGVYPVLITSEGIL